MARLIRIVAMLAFCCLALAPLPAAARSTEPVRVASGVQYQYMDRWDVDRLNQILRVDTPKFSGLPVTYTPARNAVRLYRVTYTSVIPERGNLPIVATGLLAVPDTAGTSFPLLSYQHGTVYEKRQVPSFPEQSPETQLMIAQFASQGYVVAGADYFGMGDSDQPEGYLVKASHQQATSDMMTASHAVLDHMKIRSTKLFLAGWSQGGFVTMALLEKLEKDGVPVLAAATASAPLDGFVALNGFLNFPRENDAPWIGTLFILTAFSFENYYSEPGLARSVINDAYYDLSRAAYDRRPFNPADLPTDLRKLVRAEYFDPQFFAASTYGRLTSKTQAYQWVIKTPVRNYYGENDEVVATELGRLGMTYQGAMGSGNDRVTAVSTGPTDHRGTFASAAAQWKIWFDGRAQ